MGFLYRSYQPRYVFWESVVLLRKILIATAVTFAYSLGASLQILLCASVLAIALYAQTFCRPIRKEFDILNDLEGVSLFVSLLIFLPSLSYDDDRTTPIGKTVVTCIVFFANWAYFAFSLCPIAYFFQNI